MNKENIEVLAQAQKALLEMSSLAHHNSAVNTPLSDKEYATLAEKVMDIMREEYKK
jgi:hypothetical protein